MPYYYSYNSSGLLLVLVCALFAMWASANVNSTFKKYSRQNSVRRITGAQAAQRVLSANGVHGVRIERVSGNLTDHFDPRTNVIRLSDSVYDSTSTAAIGVACHEAGHAVQYAVGYAPVKMRTAIIPITNLGAQLSTPLIVGGFILAGFAPRLIMLAYLGVACFGLCALFQLITLPTEFNASRRAVETIDGMGILQGEELDGAKKVLRAAALTYVAALAVSLMQLLRFVIMLSGRRRD